MSRRDHLIFWAVVLLALVLRGIYLAQLARSPLFEQPILDEAYHDEWARAIVAGETYIQGPYFRAPLYPTLLAAIYATVGHGTLAPRIAQALMGSLAAGGVFLIGRRMFGRAVGAVAGFAAASYWILIYYDGELLIPSLIVFLDVLALWLLIGAAERPTALRFGGAGLVLGASAIARPNILLFVAALVPWLLLLLRPNRAFALRCAGALLLGCVLFVAPVTVRNLVVGDDLVLISSQAGVNFYIGNNPSSDGTTAIVPGTPGDWWGGYRAAIRRAEEARGRALKPSEVSDYYFAEAWQFARTEPAAFLGLLARKLRLFWSRWEIPNNKNIYFWSERFTPLLALLPLGFGVVAPLGLLGLVLCLRSPVKTFPLWGFVLVYTASVVVFFCNARYRVPILPALILLGTHALFWSAAACRERRWLALAHAGVVLVAAALYVNVTPFREDWRSEPESYVTLARAQASQGDLDLAIATHREALELYSASASARYGLAGLLLAKGERSQAIDQLRLAADTPLRPEGGESLALKIDIHRSLGRALQAEGRWSEAREHLIRAAELRHRLREPRSSPQTP